MWSKYALVYNVIAFETSLICVVLAAETEWINTFDSDLYKSDMI